ncbi:MAG: molybdopterin-binding protein [Burkholderiales bacterium]|nr:molybdopterin-binding protein [Anaerolineae bacterium]
MKFGPVPLDDAVGHLIAHKLLDGNGHKLFSKGHRLTATDVDVLRANDLTEVVVAALDTTDLHEDEAAQRVGMALSGAGVKVKAPGVGRANLIAQTSGPLRLNVPALERLNNIDEGITIATIREHTLVHPGDLLALVKIIPYAVPESRVVDVEATASEHAPILAVRPLQAHSVGLIVSGPAHARDQLVESFRQPVKNRIEPLGSSLAETLYVAHTVAAITEAISAQKDAGRGLILLAGVSAIIDREDVVPSALEAAGGNVAHFGVPVDPGSLLMLGYLADVPVIGAPGCIKSMKTNVIDWILPRLLAGERLTHAHLVAMGHGGLLDDIHDRPMPRDGGVED